MRFQFLTAESMKMAAFRVLGPCSLVEVCRRFRGACYSALLKEAPNTSETSVNVYQTTRRKIPANSYVC
jgi:hypothetical protein